MNEKHLQLLNQFRAQPSQKEWKAPTTLFDLLGIAERELSYSKLLSFYFDPNENHGLGSLCLDAFLEAIPISDECLQNPENISTHTEVVTGNGNRIDLLVTSDPFVMGVENKIRAEVANPFDDYIDHLLEMAMGKKVILITLSMVNMSYTEHNGGLEQMATAKEKYGDQVIMFPLSYTRFISVLEHKIADRDSQDFHVRILREMIATIKKGCGMWSNPPSHFIDQYILAVRDLLATDQDDAVDLKKAYYSYMNLRKQREYFDLAYALFPSKAMPDDNGFGWYGQKGFVTAKFKDADLSKLEIDVHVRQSNEDELKGVKAKAPNVSEPWTWKDKDGSVYNCVAIGISDYSLEKAVSSFQDLIQLLS